VNHFRIKSGTTTRGGKWPNGVDLIYSGCTKKRMGLAGLDLIGHRDLRLWRLYFLIFSNGSCFVSCFLVFSFVFHMAPIAFRVIKSQKELTFPSKF
jgi:hypothetical protein